MKSTLVDALQTQDWFSDPTQLGVQERLYRTALALGRVNPTIDEKVQEALLEDLRRRPVGGSLDAATFDGLRNLGSLLAGTSMGEVLSELPAVDWTDPDLATSVLRVKLEFATVLRERGEAQTDQPPLQVGTSDVLRAMQHGTGDGYAVAAFWLGSRPPLDEVSRLIGQVRDRAVPPVREALTAWAQEASQEERTALAVELVAVDRPRSQAMDALATGGPLDELKVVRRANRRIRQLKNGDKRLAAAKTLGALELTNEEAADLVVDLIYWLTGKRRPKTDQAVARALIPALRKAALAGNEKFIKAIERGSKRGLKLSGNEGTILKELDVGLRKSWFGKKVAGWLGLD